ncbi:Endonuclease III [Candidatus Entotheonellaceae bacterium PAL068K]
MLGSRHADRRASTQRHVTRPAPELQQHLSQLLVILQPTYPEAQCALTFSTPLELLIATILSAQCTDERVNRVTRTLFVRPSGSHKSSGSR